MIDRADIFEDDADMAARETLLEGAIRGEGFGDLPKLDQSLLTLQLNLVKAYRGCLDLRLYPEGQG